MTQIWRSHIKPHAEGGIDPHKFCIEREIIGIGWPVDTDGQPLDWETYYRLGKNKYGDNGWWRAVNALHNKMEVDDLCWSRNPDGIYYLGRITGKWEYRDSKKYKNADMVNVRKCEWHEIGLVDSVPGKVVNSFIASRTIQRVNDASVKLFSRHRYNELSAESLYDLSREYVEIDIFNLISDQDCEDIIGIYLQEKGWRLIPSSCKSDTLRYEFVLKRRDTEKSALVQVKQGSEDMDRKEYGDAAGKNTFFLFTTQGNYTGPDRRNVHCLNPRKIKDFVLSNRGILSDRLNRWIDVYEKMQRK